MQLYIGIDDTDSKKGLCTTYLAAVLGDMLAAFSSVLETRLVRLNPNIPWKTRGNGAVCLKIETSDAARAKNVTLTAVEEFSELESEGTNPGVVFYSGAEPELFESFYYRALREIVTTADAEELAKDAGCEIHRWKNGRGVIGALAAIGADLQEHTFEHIAYRKPENWGTARRIDSESVREMDRTTRPMTLNNVDSETSQILVAPSSPCPVLYGIRGTTPEVVEQASKLVKCSEPIERTALFKTNQGTDAHLVACTISEARPDFSVIVGGSVSAAPKTLAGGHVVFSISDDKSSIDCAAYEPTGGFRKTVKKLGIGDVVRVYGGVRKTLNLTVNLEKLEVIELGETVDKKNPVCHECEKRMESAGRGQGFRCRKCRTTAESKELTPVKRELELGVYCVPARAMRHLSKPIFVRH